MKKPLILLLALCLLLGYLPARADTARDVGAECALAYQDNSLACGYLVDHNYVRGDNLASKVEHIFYVTPDKTPVAQIEVFFGTHMLPYRVERQDGAGWATVARVTEARAQSYVRLEPIAEKFRIVFSDGQRSPLTLKEILLFSEGETESTALKPWRDPCEKADVMTLVAHPDDELLWFGGLLPTYAGERQLRVQAVYMTCENALRRQELLNGLWHCGVRNYPLLCGLKDVRYSAVDAAYQCWGRETAYKTIVRAIRRFQPDVLVTHDILGEYGHTQHIVTSDAAYQAVLLAADPGYDLGAHYLLRVLSRVILLPVVAGISYETLKGLAHSENKLCRILRAPGMQLQRLTTAEPDDSMLEVAIVSMKAALGDMPDGPLTPEGYVIAIPAPKKDEAPAADPAPAQEEPQA